MRFAKTKAVALSALVTLLCLAALVVGTVAIFSDSSSGNVHLAAGRLSVGLYRTEMSGTELLPDGTVAEMPKETDPVDLETDDSSVFDIQGFIPGMWREAVLRVDNNGTVAFNFDVSIVNVSLNGGTAASQALSEQITVTVYNIVGSERTQVASFHLSEYEEKGQNISLGKLNASEEENTSSSAYFAVHVSFDTEVTGDDGNLAQGGDVSFDLRVYAEQETASE